MGSRYDPAIVALLDRMRDDRVLHGWQAIREWFAGVGVAAPEGPSVARLRKWRERHGMPVVQGTGKREPMTFTHVLTAWCLARPNLFLVRRGEEAKA